MDQKQFWENKFVRVEYHENDNQLYFIDKTDPYNEPRGYTRKVRGIKKALNYLGNYFDCLVNFNEIITTLDNLFDLNIHTYCSMD